MMSTFLVTGAAGFIGQKVSKLLMQLGHVVIGIDNLNNYYDVQLKEYRLASLKDHANFEFFRMDIEDLDALRKLFSLRTFDGVINLAARAGVRYSMENPFVYMTTNALGSLNLLEAMRENKVRKLVLASTSSLYAGQTMPFGEDLPVNTPISQYAATKKAAEVMAYTYHYLYGLDVTILRYFTVYGPAGRPDMGYFRFIRWIDDGVPIELFGDGTQGRDFTFIDDIARGTVAALRPMGYEIINLGGGLAPVSMNDLISKIEASLGKKAIIERKPFHKTDLKATQANISKAKRLLEWQPDIDIDTGIRRTVEWYLDNRTWLQHIKT